MNTVQSLLDLSYLEMMADGDADMKKTMLDMLLEEMPPELEKLRAAFLAGDADQLHQVAHKMKSTLAFVGNGAMTVANEAIESIGKEGCDLQRVGAHLEVLETTAKSVIPALEQESTQLG